MGSSGITNVGRKVMLNRTYNDTPDYSNISKFKIGIGTVGFLITDTALETPVTAWNSSADTKDFVSGYPTIDETNNEVSIRCFVGSSQANANNLSEVGLVNTDSSEKLSYRATHTAISKTSSDEVVYVINHVLT